MVEDLETIRHEAVERRALRLIELGIAYKAAHEGGEQMSMVDAALEVEASLGLLTRKILARPETPGNSQ